MEHIRNILPVPAPPIPSASAPDRPSTRADGWTAERIRAFLDTLAETGVVAAALRAVGMRKQSAYALRRRSPAFDAAWRSALLRAHDSVATEFTSRALHGCVEPIIRDGKLWGERHRFDNRLSMVVLARLDRLADSELDEAAVCVAQDFAAFVDSLCAGEVPETTDVEATSVEDAWQPSTRSISVESRGADGADPPLGDGAWQPSTWSVSLDFPPTDGRAPVQARLNGAHAPGIREAGARGPPRLRSCPTPVRGRRAQGRRRQATSCAGSPSSPSSQALSWRFGSAPTLVAAGRPFLNRIIVGMPRTP